MDASWSGSLLRMRGFSLPHIKRPLFPEAKLLNWCFDKMNLPDGLVKTPALKKVLGVKVKTNLGFSAVMLWSCGKKKQKAPSFRAAARAAKSKAIPNNDIHELVRPHMT